MNQRQSNTLSMVAATAKYMSDNAATWSINKTIGNAVNALAATKDAIEKKMLNQTETDTKGYTAQKNIDLGKMATLAFKLSKRVNNYAGSINDAVLMQATKVTMHDLEYGKEKDIISRCAMIADKADAVVADAPGDFGITAAGITALRTAIALVEPASAERDVVSGNHTNATASLTSLFTEARENLTTLDGLMEGFSDDEDDDFVNGYFIIRRVRDIGAGAQRKKKMTEMAEELYRQKNNK